MQFYFGIAVGLVIATLCCAILAFFRAGIEKRIKIIETVLTNAGPRPKGAIFMPEDEADILREEKIAENRAAGKDTHISELQ